MRSKNHKLNRAVQAMLFAMIECGMDGEVLGNKGKLRAGDSSMEKSAKQSADAAMWAVVLAKELWKKSVW
jgi:protein SDA1